MREVTVTRLRHPLEGQTLTMLEEMRRRGRLEVLLVLADGSKSLIPAEWTDLMPIPPASSPATVGSVADLAELAAQVDALISRRSDKEGQTAQRPSGEEEHRAACPTQFATGTDPNATRDDAEPSPGPGGDRSNRRAGSSGRRRRSNLSRGGGSGQ